MIIHRALRDIQRCRAKYGKAWAEYEKQVPYMFIPVSVFSGDSLEANRNLVCYLEKHASGIICNYYLQGPLMSGCLNHTAGFRPQKFNPTSRKY